MHYEYEEENAAAELDEVFIDDKTRRIAERYEQYRKEYSADDLKAPRSDLEN